MKFIFTCGGTAGHINPALAVAGRLRELMPESEFLFIGVNGKMEMDLVPRAGYEIRGLDMTYIVRGHDLHAITQNLETLRNVMRSTREAKKIIREFEPDAVIGTGGYICYPVLTAAHDLKIPTLVHESNAVPGLTTKLLADRIDRVMVGFEESRQYYRHPERVTVTGTPVRGEFDLYTKQKAREELGLADGEKLVLSVWGSLGAQRMNEIMGELMDKLDGRQGFRLVHAAGSLYYPRLLEKLKKKELDRANVEIREYIHDMPRLMAAADLILCRAGASTISELSYMGKPVVMVPSPNVTNNHQEKNARVLERAGGAEVREYIYDMPRLMAASDLILCRAGASTISELCYMGKPVVMVPSPNVTNNHQEKNARVLEHAGGAEVLLEGDFNADSLLARVRELLADEEKLRSMGEAMNALAVRDACERIVELILELCAG